MTSLAIAFLLMLLSLPALAAPLVFTVNTSETVTVDTSGGTPSLSLDIGGVTRSASYTGGSGTSALTFSYTPQPGDLDLDGIAVNSPLVLNGGTIRDAVGNSMSPLTFTLPDTSGVKVDYPSLSMDFTAGTSGAYGFHNGTSYNTYSNFSSFLSAIGGTFTNDANGTYFDSSGMLRKTSSANIPRFDHDPVTLQPRGILIEESRRNLLIRSSEMNNAVWTISGGSVATDSVNAPDGTMSAERFSAINYIIQPYSAVTIGTTYTFSIWLKSPSGSGTTSLFMEGNVSGAPNYLIASRSISLTSNWLRYDLTGTVPTGYASTFRVSVRSGSYDAWGAQLEQGSFATSYIPTTTASVTRAADVFTVPAGAWYSPAGQTLFSEAALFANTDTFLATLAENGVDYLSNRYNGSFYGAIRRNDGVNGDISSGGTYAYAAPFRMALSNDAAGGAFSWAGNSAISNAIVAQPSVNYLQVGGLSFGSVTGRKIISKVKYYPARVSNWQLQHLTQ